MTDGRPILSYDEYKADSIARYGDIFPDWQLQLEYLIYSCEDDQALADKIEKDLKMNVYFFWMSRLN